MLRVPCARQVSASTESDFALLGGDKIAGGVDGHQFSPPKNNPLSLALRRGAGGQKPPSRNSANTHSLAVPPNFDGCLRESVRVHAPRQPRVAGGRQLVLTGHKKRRRRLGSVSVWK